MNKNTGLSWFAQYMWSICARDVLHRQQPAVVANKQGGLGNCLKATVWNPESENETPGLFEVFL